MFKTMQYKLGSQVLEKDLSPGRIVYYSLYKPENIEKADADEKFLIEIGVVDPEKRTYTYYLLEKELGTKRSADKIQEGNFGIGYFYETTPV